MTKTEVRWNSEKLECTTRLRTFIPETPSWNGTAKNSVQYRSRNEAAGHGKLFNCSEINGRTNRKNVRELTPLNKSPVGATDSVGSTQLPPHGCRTFLLQFALMGYGRFCGLWVWHRRPNRWPCCLPMSNPSTSPCIGRPGGSVWWDNRLAALVSSVTNQWTERTESNDNDKAGCGCVL